VSNFEALLHWRALQQVAVLVSLHAQKSRREASHVLADTRLANSSCCQLASANTDA
jgi:hypothetical protein